MARLIQAWQAELDGSLHHTDRAATEHDLRLLTEKLSNRVDDETPPVRVLALNAEETIHILGCYVKAHPGTIHAEELMPLKDATVSKLSLAPAESQAA